MTTVSTVVGPVLRFPAVLADVLRLRHRERPARRQFSQAMSQVFEDTVGYLFRRLTRRARPAITLITEEQMQQAWTTGGHTPSVCDWVLMAGKYCLLVDATNHWLDEKAAQGFADEGDYSANTEETFVNKKFLQLKSTNELLAEKGWEGCTFDEHTVYVPSVIVPNAGIPATVLSDVDFKLQVFEDLCEHRAPKAFVEMLAKWRELCTNSMPVTFGARSARQDRDLTGHPHLPRAAGAPAGLPRHRRRRSSDGHFAHNTP
jgi:hypothetical protein